MSLFCIGKKLRSSGHHNLTQNIVEKFTKLSKIGFPIECFTFCCFLAQLSNVFWMPEWVLTINSAISGILLCRSATRTFTFGDSNQSSSVLLVFYPK